MAECEHLGEMVTLIRCSDCGKEWDAEAEFTVTSCGDGHNTVSRPNGTPTL